MSSGRHRGPILLLEFGTLISGIGNGLADEILYEAIEKMVRNDIGRLPVVSRDNPRQVLGYLGRAAVMTARLHRMKEEHEREPGWLHKFS